MVRLAQLSDEARGWQLSGLAGDRHAVFVGDDALAGVVWQPRGRRRRGKIRIKAVIHVARRRWGWIGVRHVGRSSGAGMGRERKGRELDSRERWRNPSQCTDDARAQERSQGSPRRCRRQERPRGAQESGVAR